MKNELFKDSEWTIVERLITLPLIKDIKEANEVQKYSNSYEVASISTYKPVFEGIGNIYFELPYELKLKIEKRAEEILVDYDEGKFPINVTSVMMDTIVKDVLEVLN